MPKRNLGFQSVAYPMIVKQGSSLTIKLKFADSSGNPKNMSGYTFAGHVRKKPSSATIEANWNFDLSSASIGEVFATLPGSETDSMSIGESKESEASQFFWDLRYSKDGVDNFTPMSPLTIEPRITK